MVKHKTNYCEGDGAPQPGRVFRISVCLKQFFSDERALACVQVSGSRPVRWLARRLRRAFPLPRALRLLSRGHLLPPDEPLALLERDDLVQVVPVQPADEPESDHVTSDTVLEECTARAHVVRSPSPDRIATPPPVLNNLDNLLESKRKAIQLLEQYCSGDGQDQEHVPPDPTLRRARRRRVRRRRRTVLPCIPDVLREHRDDLSATTAVEADSAMSTGDNSKTKAAAEADAPRAADTDGVSAGEVLRNASPARAPRVVRPLTSSA